MKSMRALLALVASALLSTAFFAASAQACSYPEGEQVFSAWGDPRSYVLAPDGDFAAGGAGWTLEGEAAVVSEALELPAGSSAVSPSLCISEDTPFLRSMARDSGVPGAKLQVEIIYEQLDATRSRVVARDKQEDWDPTQPLGQNFGLATADGNSSVRVRLTAVGGDWQVDDFYVDPFARR
ncbi:MAG TPA: hypothetical protein VFY69_09880 [Solirubrobacterales bacterium]|nr:hypothetical protein [Solirubrobacterales bacterium]